MIHTYRVFAGPKTAEALAPYGAEELAAYRKNQLDPVRRRASAAYVITPAARLDLRRDRVGRARSSAASAGNYGIAIILLTLLVRLLMFPLGRKQALTAKKMQDLQPLPEGDPGEVQGRQGAADPRDLGPLQEARGQPGRAAACRP